MTKRLQLKFKAFLGVLFCGVWLTSPVLASAHNESHNVNAASASLSRHAVLFQDRVISGTIKDQLGDVLPGANVLVKGTTIGTTADGDGKFSLTLPSGGNVLVVSFIGYASQEIAVEGQSTLNIVLQPDPATLSEVVVVGYGTQKRSDLTGAISSVKAEDLNQLPMQRVDQALQGRAPGVMVLNPSGQPGGKTTIRIRGMNSITGSNQPLVVVDGLQGVEIESLNPNDIESIEILKDASATAIYGSQGANGVLLITTKRGKKGTPVISYSYSLSYQQLREKLDLMNAADFARTINDNRASQNQPGDVVITPTPIFTDDQIANFERNGGTDWQDAVYRTAPMQTHQLGISGGTDNVQYLVSGGYLDQQGILLNSEFQRFTLRSNVNIDINKWLGFGLTWAGIREKGSTPPFGEGPQDVDALGQVVSLAPRWGATIPIYDELGNYSKHPSNFGEPGMGNPVASAKEVFAENNTMRNNLNAYLEFKPLKGLAIRITGGAVTRNSNNYRYMNENTFTGFQKSGLAQTTNGIYTRLQNSNIITYNKQVGIHNFTITGVAEQQVETDKSTSVEANGFSVDDNSVWDLGGAATRFASSYNRKRVINSYLARVNYSLADKYLLTASYRADGSSVFGANN